MVKKILLIVFLLFATLSFAGQGWCGIIGRWNVKGNLTGTADLPVGSDVTVSQPVKDVFVFRKDHTFKMTGAQGTWRKKLDKFRVRLNEAQMEAYIENELEKLGYGAEVAIDSYSFVVTPLADPNKIKGVIRAKIEAQMDRFPFVAIPVKITINFSGNKILPKAQTVQNDMMEDAGIAAENVSVLDAIVQSLKAELP